MREVRVSEMRRDSLAFIEDTQLVTAEQYTVGEAVPMLCSQALP